MTQAIFRETESLPPERRARPWSAMDGGDWALALAPVLVSLGLAFLGMALAGPLVAAGLPLLFLGTVLGAVGFGFVARRLPNG